MLRLVKPSKKYLQAFLRVVDDYRSDTNQFKEVQVGKLISAVDEGRADEYIKSLRDVERGIGLPDGYNIVENIQVLLVQNLFWRRHTKWD